MLAEDALLVESTLDVLSGDDLLSTVLRATVTLHGMRNPLFDQAIEQDITRVEQTLKRVVAENAFGYGDASFETLLASDWISDPRTDLTGLLLSTALLTLNGLVASKGADAWAEFLGTLEAESRLPLAGAGPLHERPSPAPIGSRGDLAGWSSREQRFRNYRSQSCPSS